MPLLIRYVDWKSNLFPIHFFSYQEIECTNERERKSEGEGKKLRVCPKVGLMARANTFGFVSSLKRCYSLPKGKISVGDFVAFKFEITSSISLFRALLSVLFFFILRGTIFFKRRRIYVSFYFVFPFVHKIIMHNIQVYENKNKQTLSKFAETKRYDSFDFSDFFSFTNVFKNRWNRWVIKRGSNCRKSKPPFLSIYENDECSTLPCERRLRWIKDTRLWNTCRYTDSKLESSTTIRIQKESKFCFNHSNPCPSIQTKSKMNLSRMKGE